jgi:peptidoglycan/xylan/chitin deacetylase (PgdA/CDA1 family)
LRLPLDQQRSKNPMKQGIFTISLDFELYWGMLDVCSAEEFSEDLNGTPYAVKEILRLFTQYQVHATWATVGLLFAQDIQEATDYFPEIEPRYQNKQLNPYRYLQQNSNLENTYHFAPDLLELIQQTQHQEVASHTFSHYYCLENTPSIEAFKADMQAAIKIAENKGIKLESLVFPRNQWNSDYLSILKQWGISSYRGNEDSWLYQASSEDNIPLFKRIIKQFDALINLSGFHTYPLTQIKQSTPYNIPASRQLRSHGKRWSFLNAAKKKRICDEMEYAARQGEIFHLWWHPEDFGNNTVACIQYLESILQHYQKMRIQYNMQSLTMSEISNK